MLLVVINSVNAQAPLAPHTAGRGVPSYQNISLTIPDALQSQIVRQDFENESIFSLKDGNNSPVFLFSVTQVTGHQWMQIKDQLKHYTIIENIDELITFVQKTDVTKFKTTANEIYKSLTPQVDGMIATVHLD